MSSAQQITAKVKGLERYLEAGEEPLLTVPGIWDGGDTASRKACEIVVTNQRLLGFVLVTFPRQRLFLETQNLAEIKGVILRERPTSPLFRELVVSNAQHTISIRTSRSHSETLYQGLRRAIGDYAPQAEGAFEQETQVQPSAPIYGREDHSTQTGNSNLRLSLILITGVFLEIIGMIYWRSSGSLLIGLPICLIGFLVVAYYALQIRNLSSRKK